MINFFSKIKSVTDDGPNGVSKVSVYGSEIFTMPTHRDVGGVAHSKFNGYTVNIPPAFHYTIKNGRMIGNRTEVFTESGDVVAEITSSKINPWINKRKRKIGATRKVKGVVANLCLGGLDNNYYHYLAEFMGRMHLLRKSGLTPDYYVVPSHLSFHKAFNQIFGIRNESILAVGVGEVVQADELVATSLINNWELDYCCGYEHYVKKHMPSWIKEIYGEISGPFAGVGQRDIYLTRAKATRRRILNEPELINLLLRYNFQICVMEDLSTVQQIELFKNARTVIGPHGAAMANMSFSPAGLNVLEIFPGNYIDMQIRIQAVCLNHHYSYTIGGSVRREGEHPQFDDLTVDVSAVERYIEKTKSGCA